MKKGIYIVYEDIEKNIGGVNKKIISQIEAFEKNGVQIQQYLVEPKYVKGYKIRYRLPFSNLAPHWKWHPCLSECDFIYLRRPFFMSGAFLKFLKKIKAHSNVPVIMEIPTYPYDDEITEKKRNYILYIKERMARRKLKGLIDRIAILTNDKEVFRIKTLPIKNGFDFQKIRLRKISKEKNCIHLCFVALFEFWHGYERMIKGLGDYYNNGGKRMIKFHFVGDGPECVKYKEMVSKLQLQDYVIFYGMKAREEIEKIYDICDIGVCSFGGYKKNMFYSCELKSREYLAVGMPIITGAKMDIMGYEELRPYILEFPNDESVANMEKIIEFYDAIYGNTEEEVQNMARNIRNIAMCRLDMQDAMKEVMEYLQDSTFHIASIKEAQ